jgi:hypothetical protein
MVIRIMNAGGEISGNFRTRGRRFCEDRSLRTTVPGNGVEWIEDMFGGIINEEK